MSLFIVNIISAVLAMLSLGVFIITARKLSKTMRLGRDLAQEIHHATSGIDSAILALRDEHQDFRDENNKLDARITESARIRRDVDRSVAQMETIRNQMQKDFDRLRGILTAKTIGSTAASGNSHVTMRQSTPQMMPQKDLPVFVHRKVHKANLKTNIQY